MAEFGFLGDIVTTRVTIPLTWGEFFNIGVRVNFGNLYFKLGFLNKRLRYKDCFNVATYKTKK